MEVKLIAMSRRMDYEYPIDICAEAAGMCVGKEISRHGLKTALESGHDSLLEHISFTFRIEGVSRVLLAQLTRHRMASYSVQSQRYVRQGKKEAILPNTIVENEGALMCFAQAIKHTLTAYNELIEMGIPQEDARYVLPEGTCTSLILTMNARELRHFFSLRCCERAQWEIRELANEMLDLCREQVPELFADAGAPCVRGECREKKPCGKDKERGSKNEETHKAD